ncbi:MAG: ATP phosphoribosyltransferase [Deltaproteobacteria bacterium]|nr:ATP phosphoribosyltransferase [Deltaproteobacteria bacterium]
MLTIALPKGRLQTPALARFAKAGAVPEEEPGSSRKLIVPSTNGAARFLVLKDGDVPMYVERGAADLGVCGLDQLLESGADVLTPIDFGFGQCRLCLAAPKASLIPREGTQSDEPAWRALIDSPPPGRSLRVATKYPRIALRAFEKRGVPVELLPLSGSVELAAVAGLADAIVDLVESGRTLRENGLEVAAELLQISARLVVNRAAWRLKAGELHPLLDKLSEGRP